VNRRELIVVLTRLICLPFKKFEQQPGAVLVAQLWLCPGPELILSESGVQMLVGTGQLGFVSGK
jgi:hypothetical protein